MMSGYLGDAARDLAHALRRLVHGDLTGMFDAPFAVAFDPRAPILTMAESDPLTCHPENHGHVTIRNSLRTAAVLASGLILALTARTTSDNSTPQQKSQASDSRPSAPASEQSRAPTGRLPRTTARAVSLPRSPDGTASSWPSPASSAPRRARA